MVVCTATAPLAAPTSSFVHAAHIRLAGKAQPLRLVRGEEGRVAHPDRSSPQATGKVAFLTAKDAKTTGDGDFVSQLDVWTNAASGIIPQLNEHAPEFKESPITASYTSVITSVRGWLGAGCR